MAKASPQPAQAPRSPWMVGPAFDLLVYSGITFYSAALVLGLGRVVDPRKLFVVLNVALTLGHYAPTWLRAYGSVEELRAQPLKIIGFPILVLVVILATSAHPETLACLIYFWDRWHALMQNFGFLRIYDAKQGRTAPHWAWLDRAVLISAALWMMSCNVGLLTPLVERVQAVGFDVYATLAAVRALRWALGGLTLGIGVAYAVALVLARRKDGTWPVPKLAYLGSLIGGHALMNTSSNVFLLSCHEKVYHVVQYLALSWRFERNRRQGQPAPKLFDRLLRGRFSLPAFAGVVLLWIAVGLGLRQLISGGELYTAGFGRLFGGFALVHYYFDSFLWKARRADVRSNL